MAVMKVKSPTINNSATSCMFRHYSQSIQVFFVANYSFDLSNKLASNYNITVYKMVMGRLIRDRQELKHKEKFIMSLLALVLLYL